MQIEFTILPWSKVTNAYAHLSFIQGVIIKIVKTLIKRSIKTKTCK